MFIEILSFLQIGILVLLIFAIVNIIAGIYFLKKFKTTVVGYFFQMNFLWNIVNLIISLMALSQLAKLDMTDDLEILKYIKEAGNILKINVYFDVFYIATAIFMFYLAKKKSSLRLKGYSYAVFFQGVFLFFLDLVLYIRTVL